MRVGKLNLSDVVLVAATIFSGPHSKLWQGREPIRSAEHGDQCLNYRFLLNFNRFLHDFYAIVLLSHVFISAYTALAGVLRGKDIPPALKLDFY